MIRITFVTLFLSLALDVGGFGGEDSSTFFEESFGLHSNGHSASSSSSTTTSELSPHLFLSSKTPYYSGALGAAEPIPSQCKLVHINHLGES